MKPSTEKSLLKLSDAEKQEVLVLFMRNMDPSEFANAFFDERGDHTQNADDVISHLTRDVDRRDIKDEIQNEFFTFADELHEAICEGRKQDAVDILNRILPEAGLRPVSMQNSLFPDRVTLDF